MPTSVLGKRKFVLAEVLEKKKELQGEVTKLQSERDSLANDVARFAGEVAERSAKISVLDTTILETESLAESYVVEAKKLMSEYIDGIQSARKMFDAYIIAIKAMDNHLLIQDKMLKDIQEKQREAHQEIVNETEVLSRQQEDLNIYRTRLEKYVNDSGAEIKIVL